MVVRRLVQGRAHPAHVESREAHARLDERDGVPAALLAQFDEGPVEAVDEASRGLVVAGVQRLVEGEREVGGEAEDGRRVQAHADPAVGESGELGGGQAVEVEEVAGDLGAHGADDALHQVEVAEAVLEADDAVRAGEPDDGLGGEHGVVALVDDDVERGGRREFRVVPQQALLVRDDQVRRHREQPVGARLLGERGVPHSEGGAVPGARDDRDAARGLFDGGPV